MSENMSNGGEPSLRALSEIKTVLAGLDSEVEDATRIDRIRALEELRSVVAAAQARETAAFAASQRAAQVAVGVPPDRVGRGVAAQVGLARRVSPFLAARYVGQVAILTRELPQTFARLGAGQVSEWRALLVAQHTAWLSAADRAVVDVEIAAELSGLGTRALVDRVKQLGYRLDPRGYLDRLAQAESERYVGVRPAPDCMIRLSALLPGRSGVAVYAALAASADLTVGVGYETRTRAQVMADTLIDRVTRRNDDADTAGCNHDISDRGRTRVAINLVMTDRTLFSTGPHRDEPAIVLGPAGGPIPAELARRWITDPTGDSEVFVRRLYTTPGTGQLAAMDSSARCFTPTQRHHLLLRDQRCRTPWCDAAIAHADHITPHQHGGPTRISNGAGLCTTCNHAKQAPGWTQTTDDQHTITTTTPTGHHYASRPPVLPGENSPPGDSNTTGRQRKPDTINAGDCDLQEQVTAAARDPVAA